MAKARALRQFRAAGALSSHKSSVTNRPHATFVPVPPFNLVVISDPAARHLRVLSGLPENTNITAALDVETLRKVIPKADVILNGMAAGRILRELWPGAGQVRWVHSLSAGLDNFLFPELVSSPVALTNSRGVFRRSLAEFAIGAILFFAKDFRRMLRNQAAGRWEQFDVDEIHGKTLGVVGYGEIGRATAEKAHALGMKVIAVRRRTGKSHGDALLTKTYPPEQCAQLMAEADYVVAAAALTPETRGLIGEAEIAAMRPHAVILNIGRGPVILESALIAALESGRIRGAALDVFDQEPLPPGHPFWKMENVLLSPHCADHTATWLEEAMSFFVANFHRFAAGEPLENVVDKHAGY